MDTSEAHLDTIEAQRPIGDQRQQRYFPVNMINNGACTLWLGGSLESIREGSPPRRGFESMPEFLTNLRFFDLFHLPGESVLMNPEIVSAVCGGNKECLEKLRSYGSQMACLKSRQGDSILHLVAAWGHLELVKSIISECPSLLVMSNSKEQLPLHVAAHAGHLAVVKILIASITFVSAKLSEEEKKKLNLYLVKDKDGDTTLHTALKARYMEITACLVKANRQASFLANKDGISPLYLSVEAGNVSFVKEMLETTRNEGRASNFGLMLEGRKYLAHAALKARNTVILDVILKEDPSLADERDEKGRTCLSFAASMGYYEGVCNLLKRSTKSVYECDDDGSFPIHMAAKNGDFKVIKELLKHCPDSIHLLNEVGQNILHIAVNSGKLWLVFHLKKWDTTQHMSVEQDLDGNTPLHLATIKWSHSIIFLLIGISKEKCMLIRNNDGLTAMDIAESNLQHNYILHERLTLMVLVYFYTLKDPTLLRSAKLTRPSEEPLYRNKNKEYINALLLVAALVATVTFAAGIAPPGGFNSSAPNLGRATLATDPSLFIFLVLDTLAMQSSIIAIAALIWAQLGDPTIVHKSLNVALPFLFFALLCMPFAFFCGVFIIVGHARGFLYFLTCTFFFFLYGIIFILGPHVILQIPGVPSNLGIYFLQFLLFAYEDGDEMRQTSSHTSMEISGKDHVENPASA